MIERKDILRLLMEKFAGEISKEDDNFIEDCIRNDDEVRTLWQSIQRDLNSKRGKNFLRNLDEEKAWQSMQEKLKIMQVKKK